MLSMRLHGQKSTLAVSIACVTDGKHGAVLETFKIFEHRHRTVAFTEAAEDSGGGGGGFLNS